MCKKYSLDLLKREETDTEKYPPSFSQLCLKHKAGWKCRDAFTSFLKHSTVARVLLGFGFEFRRNCDLQLCLASLKRVSVALSVIFMYFILCIFSRLVFPKLRIAIPLDI